MPQILELPVNLIILHFVVKITFPPFSFTSPQGRHVKTGQLAAIKVMEVTEVKVQRFTSHSFPHFPHPVSPFASGEYI